MSSLSKVVAVLARVLAFVLGAATLAGALVALGGSIDPRLDVAAHLAPFWLAGALAALVCAALPPGGWTARALAGLGVLGVVASGLLIVPEFIRPIHPSGPAGAAPILRLIQFNAWDLSPDPARSAAWVAAQHPDVVTVEELTPAFQAALQAHGLLLIKGVGSTAIFSFAQRGHHPFQVPMSDWPKLPEFARATFPAPDGGAPYSVVAVHFSWPNIASRWGQREAFAELLDRYPRNRLILAGDFNLTPWSFALRAFDRRIGLERRDRALGSWPAMQWWQGRLVMLPAVLPIDHIYAGPGWRTVRLIRGPRVGSEHYPLVIDLALVS